MSARRAPPLPVALLLPDLGGGGAQRVMLTLAETLDPAQFDVRLLVLGGAQTFAPAVPRRIPVEIGSAARVRDGLPWLFHRLRVTRPGVAVSAMGYMNLALLASRPLLPHGIKIVVREANTLAATRAALPRWLPVGAVYRRLYPRADAIVSPSGRIRDEIAASVPRAAGRIDVIPNPVDVDALRGLGPPRRREGHGLRLVAAGRLTRQKGFERLLPVIASMAPSTCLSIFGTGPDEEALRAEISARRLETRIRLEGFTRDLPAWIAGADAFVLPSRWEGLPNVVLESLALGTPVIASPEAAVEEVAAAASPRALTIADPEQGMLEVLRGLPAVAQPPASIRPSLLPPAYLREAVAARWAAMLNRVAIPTLSMER